MITVFKTQYIAVIYIGFGSFHLTKIGPLNYQNVNF